MTIVRKERIAGYVNELARRGLRKSEVWGCEDNKLSGLEAMMNLHRSHPEITAVVCNGDMVALGASLALARLTSAGTPTSTGSKAVPSVVPSFGTALQISPLSCAVSIPSVEPAHHAGWGVC